MGRLVPVLAPTMDDLKDIKQRLINKRKATVAAKKGFFATLNNELKKKPKLRNQKLIANMRKKIAACDKLIKDIDDAIKLTNQSATELQTKIDEKAQADQEEAEAAAAAAAEDSGGGGSDGGGSDGGAAAAPVDPTALSPELRLEQALAGRTPDTADDLAVANQILGLYEGRLSQTTNVEDRISLINAIAGIENQIRGYATSLSPEVRLAQAIAGRTFDNTKDDETVLRQIKDIYEERLAGTTDIETRINLINALAGIEGQLRSIGADISTQTGLIDKQTQMMLDARRNLYNQYGSNIWSVVPRSGGLVINQNFQSQPTDPFTWLRQSQFAAQSI